MLTGSVKFGQTALVLSVENGDTECIEALLEAGADANAGEGALAWLDPLAAGKGFVRAVVNRACRGDPPVVIAASYGYTTILEALIGAGADVNHHLGITALESRSLKPSSLNSATPATQPSHHQPA